MDSGRRKQVGVVLLAQPPPVQPAYGSVYVAVLVVSLAETVPIQLVPDFDTDRVIVTGPYTLVHAPPLHQYRIYCVEPKEFATNGFTKFRLETELMSWLV